MESEEKINNEREELLYSLFDQKKGFEEVSTLTGIEINVVRRFYINYILDQGWFPM